MSEEPEQKNLWRKPKRNWGFWVLIIAFIAFLITLWYATTHGYW